MKISSLIDIIGGELLNSPSISFIYSFKNDPTKVKQGDLFIAKNLDDVALAVENGAFAILLENFYPIIDEEIAWIKVPSLQNSLTHLLRFKLANFTLEAYSCDLIEFDFFESLLTNNEDKIFLLSKNLDEFFKNLDDLDNNSTIICSNKELLAKVYPDNKSLNEIKPEISKIIKHSLFEFSFLSNEVFYQKVKIPKIYLEQYINVINFLSYENDTSKLKSFNHFKPIFLDKSLNTVEFGKSERFLLVQKNKELVAKELEYLNENFTYGKTLVIAQNYQARVNKSNLVMENLQDLKNNLEVNSFNCVYLIDYNYEDIKEFFTKEEESYTLF